LKLVVDANIFISALIRDSTTRNLIFTLDNPLVAPERLQQEVDKYRGLVQDKSGLTTSEVDRLIEELFNQVEVIPFSEVQTSLDQARQAIPDRDDSVFLATALVEDATVWSDDQDFQEQDLVPDVTTTELIDQING